MLFNSFDFLVFCVSVVAMYWLLPTRAQNALLVGASLFFYGVADWRLVSLILLCAAAGYASAALHQRSGATIVARTIGIVVPLGILGVFKYFDFFVSEIGRVLGNVGLGDPNLALRLVLPVGISFFTFQTIGYYVDVSRGRLAAEQNVVDFLLFVTFFPQLVAGPIERSEHLLPQIKQTRKIDGDDALRGLLLIAQGLVKKVVVADTLGRTADGLLALDDISGPLVVVVAVLFGLQIYGDFSGYSDIARGVGLLLGFDLFINFRQPYASTSPAEFWSRWHITLGSWFRDYVYIPLGGNRSGAASTLRNLMVTMTLSGLWHGASVNFVLWGVFHGLALIAHRLVERQWSSWPTALTWLLTMGIVFLGWLMFRVADVGDLATLLLALVTDFRFVAVAVAFLIEAAPFVAVLIFVDVVDRAWVGSARATVASFALAPVLVGYIVLAVIFGVESGGQFIYFQF